MFPATAALAWAGARIHLHRFRLPQQVVEISPGSEQMWRAGTEIGLAATFVVFLFTYLTSTAGTAISAMARWCGSPGWC